MPKQYESMRDSFMKQGLSRDKAQSKAAAIYNSKHKSNPVGPKHVAPRGKSRSK